MPSRIPGRAVSVLAVAVAVAGCSSGPVAVRGAPAPTGSAGTACQALLTALPGSLGKHLDRRKVTPDGVPAAAFGDGPVLLTCGVVGRAPGYEPTSLVQEIDGVAWYPEQLEDATRWSTPTRDPQVVLVIPGDVPPDTVLVSVGAAVRAHTKALVEPLPIPSPS